MKERLQKVLAQAGIASRREAEKIILSGRIKVNGQLVKELGVKVDLSSDQVAVDGKKIRVQKKVYYLFNKPRGVITSMLDPEGRKTVADYFKNIPEKLFPVGRLDYNTEGLLLLTNDGELAQLLSHPKHVIKKTYRAEVLGLVSDELLDRLRLGLELEDGLTAPALVELVEYRQEKNQTVFDITIHEGRNRQVRRMCDAIGHAVRNLKRIKFAGLSLSGLKRGGMRELDDREVKALYRQVEMTEDV